MKALGFIEIRGLVPAVQALDTMTKAADVDFVTWEKKLGGWLVTVIVEGEVSAVKMAVEAAKDKAINFVASSAVIPNPHSEIRKLIELSRDHIV